VNGKRAKWQRQTLHFLDFTLSFAFALHFD